MNGSYSAGAKFLHWLALNSESYKEMLFDIERRIFLSTAAEAGAGDHVFVQGLARAGTTILTRALYDSNEFASLTYNDMPFIMTPNLWGKITSRFGQAIDTHERAHGDGILVDGDSPEALDEVFWKTFCSDRYIQANCLVPHEVENAVMQDFAEFVRLVLYRYGKKRYLSKNNNNILRLPSLAQSLPDAYFLVPVRDPIDQSNSLQRQHQKFLTADKFTRRYMDWLGHYEFGANHRPSSLTRRSRDALSSPADIEHWLKLWIETYRYLVEIVERHSNVRFISYSSLCTDGRYWPDLCSVLKVSPGPNIAFHKQEQPKGEWRVDPVLRSSAYALYAQVEAQTEISAG